MRGSEDWERGYRQGEFERQALAIANSELRSENLKLKQKVAELREALEYSDQALQESYYRRVDL